MYNLGDGDYHETGQYFADRIAARTGMMPNWSVLDIGCGTGRIAAPLVKKLNGAGSYIGFDISARATRWARRNISGFGTPVRFFSLDIANGAYNPRGNRRAKDLSFPVLTGSLDLCFAVSLFPHLRAATALYYLQESARVLKPGSKLFVTAFLIDDEAGSAIGEGRAQVLFRPINEIEWTTDLKTPERTMAFSKSIFLDWASYAGLSVVDDVERGSWLVDGGAEGFQDVIVLQKMTTSSTR